MAKLSTAARSKLPKKDFAGPKIKGKPSFPLENKSHDRAAIRDVPRAVKAGSLTKSEGSAIKAKAERKLGDKPKGAKPARMSSDDRALGHGNIKGGNKRGHMEYT